MTFLEQELQKIFKDNMGISDICFVGNRCYGKISETLCMKAYFKRNRISDRYEILQIVLISNDNGMIDSIEFHFSELFGKKKVDNTNFPNGIYPYILVKGQDDVDWFEWHPGKEDYKVFSNAVRTYLNVFRSKEQKTFSVQTPNGTIEVVESPDKHNPGVVVMLIDNEGIENSSVTMQYLEREKNIKTNVFISSRENHLEPIYEQWM